MLISLCNFDCWQEPIRNVIYQYLELVGISQGERLPWLTCIASLTLHHIPCLSDNGRWSSGAGKSSMTEFESSLGGGGVLEVGMICGSSFYVL